MRCQDKLQFEFELCNYYGSAGLFSKILVSRSLSDIMLILSINTRSSHSEKKTSIYTFKIKIALRSYWNQKDHLISVIRNSSSFCEYKYCQPLKQWSTCLSLRPLSMNLKVAFLAAFSPKSSTAIVIDVCGRVCIQAEMPYVLLTRCTY